MLYRRTFCLGLAAISSQSWSVTEREQLTDGTAYRLLPSSFRLCSLAIDPPPSDNLEEAKLLHSMQQVRTSIQVEAIQEQNENPVPLFWQRTGVNERDFPMWSAYINEAVLDTESVLLYFKKFFNRPRPTVVLPTIQPPVPVPWHAAYPSGHATQAVVIAALLSKLSPEAGGVLMNFALEVGHNRELAGLHYPSDTRMGIKLGKQLAEMFLPLSPS